VNATSKPSDVEAWLNQLGQPSADRDYKPGHERLLALLQATKEEGYVLRQPKLRIRVAGTNGKGSTSHYLAAAFSACGYKVGLYTSPHIRYFHERMMVQGKAIADANLKGLMGDVMPLALAAQTSYFETATALALLFFSQQHVDVEILEAGVGARLDATTAVPADVGLLTPVALDHQAWLGDNLTDITIEKSFIFNGCTIAISTEQDETVKKVLQALPKPPAYSERYEKPLGMLGEFQHTNAGLAWSALQAIALAGLCSLDFSSCAEAIAQCLVPGRLQHVQWHGHQLWLDAAHNAHATQALLPELAKLAHFDVIFVCTREDRDLTDALAALATHAKKVVVMTGKKPYVYTTVADALSTEMALQSQGKFLVLGSFITLAETLNWLESHS